MADTGKIYQAIPAIMGELNAIGKNKRNIQQGFMYRGVDDVMNELNPALVKNKVFIVPEVIEQTREDRKTANGYNMIYSICRVRFRFIAEDGSSVEAVTSGEGMDTGDKATNKAMAIAFKYACFQIFCIPTEDMNDPDQDSDETEAQKNEKMSKQAAGQAIDDIKIKVIKDTIRKKGLSEASILGHYKLQSFTEMIMEQWSNAMKLLEKYQDKEGKA